MLKKIIRTVLFIALLIASTLGASTVIFGLYFYLALTVDLPRIETLSDYTPNAVTKVFTEDGKLLAEYFKERRYPVKLKDIPTIVKKAFLAAEDANFYQHPGIDLRGIIRAIVVNLRNKGNVQGASTITQQTVKSLVLSRKKTYERKAREAILAYRLEKALTKDEIFEIYLNQIYLGSTAFGVKAASLIHFRKELDQLSIAEAAFLAGFPQRPSVLSNPKHWDLAKERQLYVLNQMLKNGFISTEEFRKAKVEDVKIFPPDGPMEGKIVYAVPYFESYVHQELDKKLANISSGLNSASPGGFEVITTANIKIQESAEWSLKKGLQEVDKRRGWRGPKELKSKEDFSRIREEEQEEIDKNSIQVGRVYKAIVGSIENSKLKVFLGKKIVEVDASAGWLKRFIDSKDNVSAINPLSKISKGSLVEISVKSEAPFGTKIDPKSEEVAFKLDQTPDVQGAMVLSNALTGELKAIVGGYDYSDSQFNRATQALRQPGSGFKPFIYLAAMEHLGYTPASIVPDSPITLKAGDGTFWSPKNYDGTFLGPITLRTALQRSRNVVSVYLLTRLIDKLGIKKTLNLFKRFGFSTEIPPNLSISLGSNEVRIIEIIRAYGVFAASGFLADELLIKEIKSREGKIIYRQYPKQKKIINPEEAFLMANTMKGVVERGTAQVVKSLGHPVAGKTGTTNDQMDAWFIGYTPDWVCGVWVGFDVKKNIGRYETGGKAAAPVFLDFMKEFLKDEIPLDFIIPEGVIPASINLESGSLVEPDAQGAFIEYFKSGSEPTTYEREVDIKREYLNNQEF